MKPLTLIRGIVTAITSKAGKIARFSASGRTGESFTDREVFQQFGMASGIPKGAECIIVKQGETIFIIASDDRRYRLEVKEGQTIIYDQDGDTVNLNAGEIQIKNKNNDEVNLKGGEILIKSASKVVVDAQNIYLGSEALAALGGGVVTTKCVCSITGAVHPIGSLTVKSKL